MMGVLLVELRPRVPVAARSKHEARVDDNAQWPQRRRPDEEVLDGVEDLGPVRQGELALSVQGGQNDVQEGHARDRAKDVDVVVVRRGQASFRGRVLQGEPKLVRHRAMVEDIVVLPEPPAARRDGHPELLLPGMIRRGVLPERHDARGNQSLYQVLDKLGVGQIGQRGKDAVPQGAHVLGVTVQHTEEALDVGARRRLVAEGPPYVASHPRHPRIRQVGDGGQGRLHRLL
mmetsp:Transcript_10203/g.30286  ORF Transcript_10203/g.30286 Transcript_10203/m.30286 type:complete len:231 (-) Transcript_10203:572-1264(-)